MLSQPEWIPAVIRTHPVMRWFISSAILVIASVSLTWYALNATTLGEKEGRIAGLTLQNSLLHEELRAVQNRYDAAQASREDTISKRSGELSAAYRESMKSLGERYDQLLQENADLKSTLSALNSGERRQAAERKAARLSELSAERDLINRKMTEAQQLLYKTSASAGYDRASCTKEKQNFYSNVCEHAAKEEAQVRALQEKVSLLERQGEVLSNQMTALEAS